MASTSAPKCFLIVHNISKKHNIGTLARCAVAFNVAEMCLVGSKHYNTFGSHGSFDYVPLKHFETLAKVREYLKEEHQCVIFGIEIIEGALAVQDKPFTGNTAFILGNEGQGLSKQQMAICDKYVYIPQYGNGTASLNVTVAGSIILHNFCLWAGYQESEREGYKYVLGERPQRRTKRGLCVNPEDVRKEREARRRNKEQGLLGNEAAIENSSEKQQNTGDGSSDNAITTMFTTAD
jgi:tRNA C32,U32 (ribose-2'-O)-methylase TrmJ